MNTEFWLIASLLTLLALLIISPALWRKNKLQNNDNDDRNIEIAKQKLAVLKHQLETSEINLEEYTLQLSELELILNDDLFITTPTSTPLQKQGRWVVYLIILLVPIAASGVYFLLGDPVALEENPPVQSVTKSPHDKSINSVDDMLKGLISRLNKQPDDIQGWLLLGKSYHYLGNANKATEAFTKAYELAGEAPNIMLQYADSLLLVNNGNFTHQSKKLVLNALELSPNDGLALWLAGLIKSQENDPKTAMSYWKKAESVLGPKSAYYKRLKQKMNAISSSSQNMASINSAASVVTTSELESIEPPFNDRLKWIELGKSLKSNKQYQQAIDAFSKADLINSQQAEAILLYADSLVMQAKGQYSEQTKALINKALSIAPNNTTGLWLAGKAKVQEGLFDEALPYLQKAKKMLTPNSDSYTILDNYIAKVVAHSSSKETLEIQVNQGPKKEKKKSSTMISVNVSLADNLKKSAKPQDTVFIYANALSGPQMPLAIVRKQVKDLPLNIVLTDAQAMTPMMKLSKFQHVNITARISKSGNAIRQAGDLWGISHSVEVASNNKINIKINQIIQ